MCILKVRFSQSAEKRDVFNYALKVEVVDAVDIPSKIFVYHQSPAGLDGNTFAEFDHIATPVDFQEIPEDAASEIVPWFRTNKCVVWFRSISDLEMAKQMFVDDINSLQRNFNILTSENNFERQTEVEFSSNGVHESDIEDEDTIQQELEDMKKDISGKISKDAMSGVELDTNTPEGIRDAVKGMANVLGATISKSIVIATSLFSLCACGAGFQSVEFNKIDMDTDPYVVTNVTFDGLATLVDGVVPEEQLPSYVDDIVEYDTRSDFPEEGVSNKIYIALDTNIQYRWSGSEYVEIAKMVYPSTSEPLMDGIASVGVSNSYARADHVHPRDSTKLDKSRRVVYTTCSTASNTPDKVAVVADGLGAFTLTTGVVIIVKFEFSNKNSSPTLNVGDTGAKPIRRYGNTDALSNAWQNGEAIEFVYDGTSWMLTKAVKADSERFGIVKISDATNGTASDVAVSQKAMHDANDAKLDKTAVVAPSTSATIDQAAGAKATGDALALVAPDWLQSNSYQKYDVVKKDGTYYYAKVKLAADTAWNANNWGSLANLAALAHQFLPITGGTMTGVLESTTYFNFDPNGDGKGFSLFSQPDMVYFFINGQTIVPPITSGTLALLENLAVNYSTSSTYALNALCVHQNKLYRCTTAITTAEAWTAAHWTEATVDDVLAALRTAIAGCVPTSRTINNKALSSDVTLTGEDIPLVEGGDSVADEIRARALDLVTIDGVMMTLAEGIAKAIEDIEFVAGIIGIRAYHEDQIYYDGEIVVSSETNSAIKTFGIYRVTVNPHNPSTRSLVKLFDLATDATPTADSTKLMTSGDIKTALDLKADDSNVVHKTGDEDSLSDALMRIPTSNYANMDAIADRLDMLIKALKGIAGPSPRTFYLQSVEGTSTISMQAVGNPPNTVTLEYSIGDSGVWNEFVVGTTSVSLAQGEFVRFRAGANSNTQLAHGSSKYRNFVLTGKVAAGGNIMSLLYHDEADANAATAFPAGGTYQFARLFYDTSTPASSRALVDASALVLPATTLANYCYYFMFSGCTSLTAAPSLPATTLANYCYGSMFSGCTALTAAPSLPAITLASSCYSGMFNGCTSLAAAPSLPATTLASSCYYFMFSGCTALTAAPSLPATTLASSCYNSMFYGCTSLVSVTADFEDFATDIFATDSWLDGVSATGTFHCKPSMTIPERGSSTVPPYWTISTDR